MKFVINEKMYDTEKMEKVGTVKKWYKITSWILKQLYGGVDDLGRVYDCELWKSKNENFLLTHYGDCGDVGQAITEEEAKELLMLYDYEAYTKLYGEIEEA